MLFVNSYWFGKNYINYYSYHLKFSIIFIKTFFKNNVVNDKKSRIPNLMSNLKNTIKFIYF
ncbi:hypothetical protein NUSPORA_02533 [Nucleospora cyclopteri]